MNETYNLKEHKQAVHTHTELWEQGIGNEDGIRSKNDVNLKFKEVFNNYRR